MKKLSLFLLVGIFVLFFTACDEKMDPNNPQSVRRAITKQQIAFTPNQFVSYAVAGDTAKMNSILSAVRLTGLFTKSIGSRSGRIYMYPSKIYPFR